MFVTVIPLSSIRESQQIMLKTEKKKKKNKGRSNISMLWRSRQYMPGEETGRVEGSCLRRVGDAGNWGKSKILPQEGYFL